MSKTSSLLFFSLKNKDYDNVLLNAFSLSIIDPCAYLGVPLCDEYNN